MKLLYTKVPPIYGFPIIGNTLSVASFHPDFKNWYYSNFIHLNSSPLNYTMSFYKCMTLPQNCPFINLNSVERWIIDFKWNNSIVDFLIDAINHSSYVYLFVDESKLVNSYTFNKFDSFTHDVMVFGYNLLEGKFNIAGNFSNGKYIESHCTFEEMNAAFLNTNILQDRFNGIILIKHRKNAEYAIHMPSIKQKFYDYLESHSIALRDGEQEFMNEVFGLNTYDVLVDCIEKIIRDPNAGFNNVRPFHFLWEHKWVLLDRLEFFLHEDLIERNPAVEHLRNTFLYLYNSALESRNIFLKYSLFGNSSSLLKVRTRLIDMKSMEKAAISALCEFM